jgi:hypothetical protein
MLMLNRASAFDCAFCPVAGVLFAISFSSLPEQRIDAVSKMLRQDVRMILDCEQLLNKCTYTAPAPVGFGMAAESHCKDYLIVGVDLSRGCGGTLFTNSCGKSIFSLLTNGRFGST